MMQLDLLPPERLPARDMARAQRAGDRAIALGADKARRIDPTFIERAQAHMLAYLGEHGISSGELLTDSCKLNGIRSSEDRHFGAVTLGLLRKGQIRIVGRCQRSKGHGSDGGKIFGLVR